MINANFDKKAKSLNLIDEFYKYKYNALKEWFTYTLPSESSTQKVQEKNLEKINHIKVKNI